MMKRVAIPEILCAAVTAATGIPACAEASATPPGPPRGRPPDDRAMQGRPPPQELVDACKNKNDGDACATQSDRGDINGVCGKGPDDKTFCRPEGRRPPPPAGEP